MTKRKELITVGWLVTFGLIREDQLDSIIGVNTNYVFNEKLNLHPCALFLCFLKFQSLLSFQPVKQLPSKLIP